MRLTCRCLVTLVTVVACLLPSLSNASQVRPVNLEEMTERAETIFSGRCVQVRSMPDPQTGGTVTRATFEVHRVVKGVQNMALSVPSHRF